MGCGNSEDVEWWATLATRDDPPEPYNYMVYAVDRDASKLAGVPNLKNIFKFNHTFNEICVPSKIDLMYAHDCLQFSPNPLSTLGVWNAMMNVNGMLVLSVPQHSGVEYNNYYSRTYSGCYHHFTPTNLIYMLAVNGFDCRDAYLLKKFGDPWINMAVYKSNIPTMDPDTTSWTDLIDTGLLHPSVVNSIKQYGYLRQEDIVMPWLDRENYFVDYVSTWTELPEGVETQVTGVFNTTESTDAASILQADPVVEGTNILKPVGVLRPPKKKYD